MRIIGYHISNGIIANSDGEIVTEPSFLDFLLEPKPDSIKIFYHIGYNIANLLKMIDFTKEKAKKLHDTEKLYMAPYMLKYAPNKFFSLSKGSYWAFFCNANQYSLAQLDNSDTPISCLAKANKAKEAGKQVYDTLTSVGLHPTTLTSPVRVYEKEVLNKLDLPTVDDMPEDAGEYAYSCCRGNWLEAFQVGHWEKAWDYDINSAYPSEIARLLDIREGKWGKSSYFIPEAEYGYCKGKVTITAPFSPIIYVSKNLNYTPVGTWETFLTKREIEFIHKWKLGEFKIESGWWWIPNNRNLILQKHIMGLQSQKGVATGLSRETIKRIMSGIYGKFLEARNNTFGKRFNPVYGAEVEVGNRLKVARFILENHAESHLIHIAVDGVLLDMPIEQCKKEWEQSH